jgi:hypothetical protein
LLNAGRRARVLAVDGVVRIVMPRFEWKFCEVKTQNLVVVLVVHVGWMVHSEFWLSVCEDDSCRGW